VAQELDIERLVRSVTDVVVERLSGRGEPVSSAPRGELLLLLPVPPARPEELAGRIDLLRRTGWDVRALASPPALAELDRVGLRAGLAAEPLDPGRGGVAAALARLSPRAVLVVGALGFAFAQRLAELADDDPFVRLVARALLDGRKVFAVADDLAARGAGAGSEAARLGAERLRGLERLGLGTLAAGDLESVAGRLTDLRSTASRAAGGLLTEADVVRLREAGETRLVLAPRTIVTPLARTKAAELGLVLVEGGT
jgi:hypothetical protein